MENASKALIMAGGILIAIMTIGALMFMFDNISEVEKQKNQNAEIDEILEFNRQFEAFDMVGLRGTDILTVMNKMVNYNGSNDVQVEGYQPMEMKVEFLSSAASSITGIKELTYDEGDNKTKGELYEMFEYRKGSNKINASTLLPEEQTEFKRKYFKCIKVEYDNNTGRVVFMEFKEIDIK